ncbi:hypothetical protein TNCV_889221 [Trichonephila clavipes]|nr:hypothetical protein TNCV_889221 [Trichonephila clavipes]
MKETTQQEKTTQLGSRNETTQLVNRKETTQLGIGNETTQLVSRNETTQLRNETSRRPPTTAVNRLHHLYSRIGFFYLLSNFEGERSGEVKGHPPLFLTHQPHERTCCSTAIESNPLPKRHYIFTNIHAFSGIYTRLYGIAVNPITAVIT